MQKLKLLVMGCFLGIGIGIAQPPPPTPGGSGGGGASLPIVGLFVVALAATASFIKKNN